MSWKKKLKKIRKRVKVVAKRVGSQVQRSAKAVGTSVKKSAKKATPYLAPTVTLFNPALGAIASAGAPAFFKSSTAKKKARAVRKYSGIATAGAIAFVPGVAPGVIKGAGEVTKGVGKFGKVIFGKETGAGMLARSIGNIFGFGGSDVPDIPMETTGGIVETPAPSQDDSTFFETAGDYIGRTFGDQEFFQPEEMGGGDQLREDFYSKYKTPIVIGAIGIGAYVVYKFMLKK